VALLKNLQRSVRAEIALRDKAEDYYASLEGKQPTGSRPAGEG
jgi:hypothetical protein